MLYFLPDSRDTIDPTYDFERETRSPDRQTRDDVYCHEVLERPYDGILLSYTTVKAGRYSASARRRLLRSGVREFFRAPTWCRFMGDCGAFSYFKQDEPPFTAREVAEFYGQIGVDFGLAVDHVVPGYSDADGLFGAPSVESQRRYDLTLALARDFLAEAKRHAFEPVGVVQGWNPTSFAAAAAQLQRMGYHYLAIGGLVRLKNEQILRVLQAVDHCRQASTRLHLLGVTRPGNLAEYISRGVASIDSTSPLRRAFCDNRHNYWIGGESYCALRIPPSTSRRTRGRLGSGELAVDKTRELEHAAFDVVAAYDRGEVSIDTALEVLLAYQERHSPGEDRSADYRRTLEDKPWRVCRCAICLRLGHHVILMRGAERNRARGFHNIGQARRGMLREFGEPALVLVGCGVEKREGACPAGELYTGSLYRAHSKIADRYRAPRRILSGLHGVIDPAKIVERYDKTIPKTVAERREWGAKVVAQLAEIVEPGSTVVALAGERYLEWTSDVVGFTVVQPLAGMTMGQRMQVAAGTSAAPVRRARSGPPIAWDFIFTTHRSSLKGSAFDEHWRAYGGWTVRLQLAADTPLAEAIAVARETKLFGKGTTKTGVFEVQNDRGIYWCPDGFVNLGLAKPERVRFISWDELEEAEERGQDDLYADYSDRLGVGLVEKERAA